MLYHSQLFICIFLPFVILGSNYVLKKTKERMGFLVAASFFFYGFWDYRLLPFLIGSIVANWLLSHYIQKKTVLWIAIGINLGALAYFKYLNFFLDSFCFLFGHACPKYNILLPLAISFVTFEHISYLVDRHKGQAPLYSLLDYAFYIAFFPKLISGPIVRHNEILSPSPSATIKRFTRQTPILVKPIFQPFSYENMAKGYILAMIGLTKKVFLSQPLAAVADPLFAKANSASLSLLEAWTAVSAFAFQLYYDFSGYSDMAIGVALMLGVVLPFNFDAPYKATSLQEFWRHWHMTLSRFLRDYVYIPLGGNRKGPLRQSIATFFTMTLGGFWHGAGINFIIWGAIHGAGLIVNQVSTRKEWRIHPLLARTLTLSTVLVAWVFFRSENLTQASSLLSSMLGIKQVPLDPSFELKSLFTIVFAAFCAVCGPTSQSLVLTKVTPMRVTAIASGVLLFYALLVIGDGGQKDFIYFQF